MEKINYPIRINRYLALLNYCSRREADRLISAGKVTVNGKRAKLGDQVQVNDRVEVNKTTARTLAETRVYFAYHKPVGIVTHPTGLRGEKSIRDVLPKDAKTLFPIGRLDKASHGLMILTNDGRITDRLLSPEIGHEKEYLVQVDKKLRPFFLRHLREGIDIEGYRTRPAKVTGVNDTIFRITLTEGKKHQIRRMCAAFDYAVRDLKRERIMNIELGKLATGKLRKLAGSELDGFLSSLELGN